MSTGFTYAGIHSDTLGLKLVRDTRRELLPQPRDIIEEIPGKHGSVYFTQYLGERIIELTCVLEGINRADLFSKRRNVAALFGLKGNQPLIFDDEPDKVYYARYAGMILPNDYVNWSRFTIPMRCSDPFAHADIGAYDESLQYDTGLQYDSGLYYPNPTSMEWVYSRQVMSQMNYGHIETSPKITITGSCQNPVLKNETSGKQIQYTGTLSFTDTLVFDMANMTVTFNGVNAMSGVSGNFWSLLVGGNHLAFESSTTPNATVQIDYNHLFL